MAFLLDTKIVSDLMHNPQGVAAAHVNRTDEDGALANIRQRKVDGITILV